MGDAVRVSGDRAVRRLTLCRPDAYNTITPALRDELGAALDEADADNGIRVVVLDAEGPAFCAGYDLAWGTDVQATVEGTERVWDSAADLRAIGSFASTWAKLHEISKPTVAAVSGWCLAGGMNIVMNADLIVCAESARFGYPPSRVWGVPEAPWTWVARLGLERAKRFMLTGDEISGPEAAELGMVLECVPDDELADKVDALAERIANVPMNQLQMIKWSLNEVARTMYDPQGSRMVGTLFDGVARHTQEGIDFVARAEEAGWRRAVHERDEPFGDYGERP
ncbi:MAG: crotonase/enoyl-CoA hydratase family protein [Acidimicrobiia bacterium]|nr:crotonase/enoyl-CoA hydratase family protein [Acidimicrobiia bacterium]